MKLKQLTIAAAIACGIIGGTGAAQAAQLSGGVGLSAGQIEGFVVHQTPYGLNGDSLRMNYRALNASIAATQPAGPGAIVLGASASYSILGGSMSGQSYSAGATGNPSPASSSGGLQSAINEISSPTSYSPTIGNGFAIGIGGSAVVPGGAPVGIGARATTPRAARAVTPAPQAVSESLNPGDVQDYALSAGYAMPLSRSFMLTPGVQFGMQRVLGESYTRRVATLGAAWTISPEWAVLAQAGIGRVHGTRNALMQREDGAYRVAQLAVTYSPNRVDEFTLGADWRQTQTASLAGLGDQYMRDRSVNLSYSRAF